MSTRERARAGSRPHPLRDAVRVFNKHVLNPPMMWLAGRRHWYAAAIRHTGRRSGKEYATPVVADRVRDGFIVPLPYGTQVDWLRNVLAAGRATIKVGGGSYEVMQPEVIDAATAFPQLSPAHRWTWRLFGIEYYLKLSISTEGP